MENIDDPNRLLRHYDLAPDYIDCLLYSKFIRDDPSEQRDIPRHADVRANFLYGGFQAPINEKYDGHDRQRPGNDHGGILRPFFQSKARTTGAQQEVGVQSSQLLSLYPRRHLRHVHVRGQRDR